MDFRNIQPVFYEGLGPVFKGAFLTATFPFAYIIGLSTIFTLSKTKNSPYKIYISGLLIGGTIVLLSSLLITLVIGPDSGLYYPKFAAVSRIKIGNFLQRLDILAAIVFTIGIYIEVNAFLLTACKGITKLFGFSDYKFIVMPVLLLILNICFYEFDSMMHYFEFSSDIWPYYVFPFEFIFPFIIWVTAEIKTRKKKKVSNTA